MYTPGDNPAELAATVIVPGVVPPTGVTVNQLPPCTVVATALNVTGLPPLAAICTCCITGVAALDGSANVNVDGLADAVMFEVIVSVIGMLCAAGKFGDVITI